MSKKNVEWEWKKLGDLYPISMGKTPPRADKSCWDTSKKTHNVWVSIADISANEDGFIYDTKEYISDKSAQTINKVEQGSLLLSFKLSIGKMAFAGVPLYTNEAIASFPPKSNIFLPYLHKYFLYFDWDKASEGDAKVKGKTLNKEKLKNIDVLVPPIDEQKRIVKVLDETFEKIEKIKSNAQANLQNAKEVFNAALSHEFDKTRFRTEKLSVCTYIRPPKNETIKGLKQTSTVSFLPMEDLGIHTRSISAIKSKLLSEVEGSYTCFANNDVLLAKVTPCFENGKMGIAENLVNGVGFGSSEYIVFRPSQNVDNVYLFYFLMTKDFVNEGKKQMLGACGLKRLSKDYVANTQIPLPPLPIQKQIVAKLDSLSEKVKQLESNYKQILADCDELKKATLKKAFEGDL